MAVDLPKWGIVSTIKAADSDLLDFVAYHLDAGAHRIFIYLDAPHPTAKPLLKAHPKVRVIETTQEYWQARRKEMPKKHQVRQVANATRAYRRQCKDLDWLCHMDVDEFIAGPHPIAKALKDLPPDTICARIRPVESLAGEGCAFKATPMTGRNRQNVAATLYPEFGEFTRFGFLSHIQGKRFVRTGLSDVSVRIHNVYVEGQENPDQAELAQFDLCHLHAKTWEDWLSHYRYRLSKGSYRAELSPPKPADLGGITLHQLMSTLEQEQGEAGLRRMFDELCNDTEEHRQRLESQDMLRIHHLELAQKRQRIFPEFG